ncbi:MAG: hypothetical protein ACHQXA_02820, partial [Gemmatimonadales bacterium]
VGPALLGRIGPHAAFSGVPAVSPDSVTARTGIHLQPGERPFDGSGTPAPVPARRHRAKER